ncbi:MAG: hypothetical protein EOO11_15845 [Chitinophagaceae bacterium]|nr:MAG: hypothetical protein EOO11_15845 [Chitinophagaceae bacterium]
MKKLLFLLSFLTALLGAGAQGPNYFAVTTPDTFVLPSDSTDPQIDSANLYVSLTFPSKAHYTIMYLVMNQVQDSVTAQYVAQVRYATPKVGASPDSISTKQRARLVLDLYRKMGEQPEYLMSTINAELKPLLIGQLTLQAADSALGSGARWLLRQLGIRVVENLKAQDAAAAAGEAWIRGSKL